MLHFEKPGHVSMEVTVLARHVQRGRPDQRKRKISFAVILEQGRRMGGLTYARPVGIIGFDPEGGCVAVEYDRQLCPQAAMRSWCSERWSHHAHQRALLKCGARWRSWPERCPIRATPWGGSASADQRGVLAGRSLGASVSGPVRGFGTAHA